MLDLEAVIDTGCFVINVFLSENFSYLLVGGIWTHVVTKSTSGNEQKREEKEWNNAIFPVWMISNQMEWTSINLEFPPFYLLNLFLFLFIFNLPKKEFVSFLIYFNLPKKELVSVFPVPIPTPPNL